MHVPPTSWRTMRAHTVSGHTQSNLFGQHNSQPSPHTLHHQSKCLTHFSLSLQHEPAQNMCGSALLVKDDRMQHPNIVTPRKPVPANAPAPQHTPANEKVLTLLQTWPCHSPLTAPARFHAYCAATAAGAAAGAAAGTAAAALLACSSAAARSRLRRLP